MGRLLRVVLVAVFILVISVKVSSGSYIADSCCLTWFVVGLMQRWQRRVFILYDDGELTYSVDENVRSELFCTFC